MPAYLRGSYQPAYRQPRNSKRYTRSPTGGLTGPRMRAPRIRAPRTLPPLFKVTDLTNDFTVSNPKSSFLTSISAGDGTNQRDGRMIAVTNVRGQLVAPSGDNVRVIIYIPKTAGDSITLAAVQDAVPPDTFTVLYDNYWHPVGNGGNRAIKFNCNLGRNGKRIEFNGTSGFDNVTSEIKMYMETGTGTGIVTGHAITTFYDM